MATRIYCAQESREQGEPLPGLGAHPEHNILLSWPMSRWEDKPRRARDMTACELDLLERIGTGGRRGILMDQPGMTGETHSVYLYPEGWRYRVPRGELEDFLSCLLAGESLDAWHQGPTPARVVLCCTHGKKDKCCARFGNASYRSLAQASEAVDTEFEVWRCTHLGGCRLAGTAIVFPARRKYGRLDPEYASDLLQAEAENRPFLPCYRGNPDLTSVQQCAEVAALEWLEAQGLRGQVRLMPCEPSASSDDVLIPIRWYAETGDCNGQLQVACVSRPVWRYGTCADIESGPVKADSWQVRSITEIPVSQHSQADEPVCQDNG